MFFLFLPSRVLGVLGEKKMNKSSLIVTAACFRHWKRFLLVIRKKQHVSFSSGRDTILHCRYHNPVGVARLRLSCPLTFIIGLLCCCLLILLS